MGIGTSTPTRALEVHGFGMRHTRYDNSANGAFFDMYSARGTEASPTISSSGDATGRIFFNGYDGTDFRQSAAIFAEVDAAPGVGDMPGRLLFKTSLNGTAAPLTRMTIRNGGNVGIGTETPNEILTVEGITSLRETTAPSNTADYGKLYVKSSDSKLYFMDDAGTETSLLDFGSGSGDFLADGSIPMTGSLNLGANFINNTGSTAGLSFDSGNRPTFSGTNGASIVLNIHNTHGLGSTSLRFSNSTTTAAQIQAINDGTDRILSFETRSSGSLTEKARIDATGRFGLGTNLPNELLTVEGVTSLRETTTPSNTANYGKLYVKSSDSKLYFMDDSGAETDLTAGGGGSGDFLADGSVDMTGQFVSTAGTAAAPGISFVGDLDTGIYQSASNQLAIAAGGAQALRIEGSSAARIFNGRALMVNGSAIEAGLSFNSDPDTGLFRPTTNQLGVSTGGTERIRIDNTGNIGLGVTSPNEKLTVEGITSLREVSAPTSTADYGKLYVKSSDSKLYFMDDSGAETDLTSGGGDFLADGSIAMTGDLQLSRNIIGGNTANVIDTGTSSGQTFTLRTSDADLWLRTINNDDIYFTTNSNERMRITNTGNVGIGSATPGSKLEIEESGSGVVDKIRLYNDVTSAAGTGSGILFSADRLVSGKTDYARINGVLTKNADADPDGSLEFSTLRDGTLTKQMELTNAGELILGGDSTTSFGSMTIENNSSNGTSIDLYNRRAGTPTTSGVLRFTRARGGNAVVAGDSVGAVEARGEDSGGAIVNFSRVLTTAESPTAGAHSGKYTISVADSGTVAERITIDGSNVGIGTTSPSERLEVAGTVKATDVVLTSDERLKTDIKRLPASLEDLSQVNAYTYRWKDEGMGDHEMIGFLAQELEEIFPELVNTGKDGLKSVRYTAMIPVLVESVKELHLQTKMSQSQLESLKRENEKMKSEIADLKSKNKDLEDRLDQLERMVRELASEKSR